MSQEYEDIMDLKTINYDDFNKDKYTVKYLVDKRLSFRITNAGGLKTGDVVEILENEIDRQNLRCRIYTSYRLSVLTGALIPTAATQFFALGTGLFCAFHNLLTYDPDYEISKNYAKEYITVKYMR